MSEEMMMPTAMTSDAGQYKKMILDEWEVIKTYSVKVMAYYLEVAPQLASGSRTDQIHTTREKQEEINQLIGLLTDMWEELEPMMKGKSNSDDFFSFKEFQQEPIKFLIDTQKVFELKTVLRKALEDLGITRIEKGEK